MVDLNINITDTDPAYYKTGVKIVGISGEIPVTYLLRATWDSAGDQGYADAQVLDTVGEGVEDGSLTVEEVSGCTVACVSNRLHLIEVGDSTDYDRATVMATSSVTRTFGYTFITKFEFDTGGRVVIPWLTTQDFISSSWENIVYVNEWENMQALTTSTEGRLICKLYDDIVYEIAQVIGGYDVNGIPWHDGETVTDYLYGAAIYIKGGVFTNWTLLWRFDTDNTTPLHPGVSVTKIGEAHVDDFRVPDQSIKAVLQPTAKSTFDAANGTSLDAYSPEVGGSYTEQSADWDIQGNLANPDGAGIATIDSGIADFMADCVVNGGAADQPAILLRFSDTSNYWYLQADRANNQLELHEVNATVDTVRANAAVTFNDSTDYDLRAIADGQNIDGFANGGNLISYGSAALNETETEHGLRAENTAGKFNNFAVFARISTTYEAEFDAV